MAHTDHSRYDRRKNKNPKRESRQRAIVTRANSLADWDAMPSSVSRRELRTYTRV